VHGRGENTRGTDGSVRAAMGGGVILRAIVAPWDGVVSPRVFANCRDGRMARLREIRYGQGASLDFHA